MSFYEEENFLFLNADASDRNGMGTVSGTG